MLIAGGGAAGLTLAAALGQRGYSVALADAGPAGVDPRAWFISGGCWRIFHALGLGEALETVSQPVTAVEADAAGGGIAFLADDAGEAGELGRMIEAAQLTPVLAEAARAAGVTMLASARAEEPSFGDPRATVAINGETISASLIVACDGARSTLRKAAGIRFEGRDHDTSALSTLLDLPAPHEGRARQIFLRTGPIAALPLPGADGRRVNLVWTAPTPVAEALVALDDAGFEAELAHQAPGFLPGSKLAGGRFRFQTGVRIAERFHAPRLALAGDSAHVVHPLAGQGLNLGLKDVAALVDVIEAAARVGLDIGSETALSPYTRWRRADVTATAAAMEAFAIGFAAPAPVRAAAGLAMKTVGGSRAARRFFMREAAGELGEVPSLMQSKAAV